MERRRIVAAWPEARNSFGAACAETELTRRLEMQGSWVHIDVDRLPNRRTHSLCKWFFQRDDSAGVRRSGDGPKHVRLPPIFGVARRPGDTVVIRTWWAGDLMIGSRQPGEIRTVDHGRASRGVCPIRSMRPSFGGLCRRPAAGRDSPR